MPGPFSSSGLGAGPFAEPEKKENRSALGAIGNLFGDVKDSVVGLPAGLVQLAKHPIRSAEGIAEATWQTYSPLFQGDFAKFGKQLYDHPLAPLLDVASVFTLGAGAAARGASALEKAGSTSATVGKVARLRSTKVVTHLDPTAQGRHPVVSALSTQAGRRVLQEGRLKYIEPNLPTWFTGARYERKFQSEMAHRAAAKNAVEAHSLQYAAMLKAGGVLDDPVTATPARREITSAMWQGLDRHAPSTRAGELRWEGTELQGSVLKGEKLPEHYRYMTSHDELLRRVDTLKTPEDFDAFLKNFAQHATTKDVAKAYRREDGTHPLVPLHDAKMLGLEAYRSNRMVRWFWQKPTRLWKTAIIGYTPRAITNNAVGNWALYAGRQGGHKSLLGLFDAIRITKGDRAASKLTQPGIYGARTSHWAHKWHLDELGDTFRSALAREVGEKGGRFRQGLREGVYPIVHKTSDRPVRLATLAAFYRGTPEVRQLMKKGVSFDDAVDAAIAQNPELRAIASQHVRTIAGDYSSLGNFGAVMKDIVPFYLWDRHIVKTGANMLLDQPGRLAIMQRLSGQGLEETKEILGSVPDFLRGAIPLESLGFKARGGGRADALLTASLNPFATLGELSSAVEGLTTGGGVHPGASVLGQANPLISGLIEAATGQSILTGAAKPSYGGILPTLATNIGLGLPQVKLLQAFFEGDTTKTRAGKEALYAKDDRSQISSFLGGPLRNISLQRAAEMAEQEKSRKKRRRKSTRFNP